MNAYPLTLYYDASCPLCHAEMHNLMLRNEHGRLAFVDASAHDFTSPVAGIGRDQMMATMHGVWADGSVSQGVDAIHAAYVAVGLGHVTAFTQWPVLNAGLAWLYPRFARNRHMVPGWLVRAVFEGPIRRSAQAAHARMNCHEAGCQLPERHNQPSAQGDAS